MRRIFPRCWFNEATTEAGSDAPGYYHECDNPWFPSVLDEERTLDLEKYPDRYSHVWLGDYARAFEGAYYASVLAQARAEGRIGKVAADRDPSASTVWDRKASSEAHMLHTQCGHDTALGWHDYRICGAKWACLTTAMQLHHQCRVVPR